MAVYGVWFSGRNTCIAVSADSRSSAIAKARKKKKRGGDSVVSARTLKGTSLKQARAGKCVRERASGKGPSKPYTGSRGMGPSKSASRKAVKKRKRK